MPISAAFVADFASFVSATEHAQTKLVSFEDSANKVGSSLSRLESTFSGKTLIQNATLTAEAVDRIGGSSKLTEVELQKVAAQAAEAAAKMAAMGIEVPPKIAVLASQVQKTGGFFSDLASQVTSVAAGFVSAQTVIGLVTGAYHALQEVVSSSVKAFTDQERAEVTLVAALRQHSLATPEVIKQYNDLATTFQRTTVYADEQINAMEALLTQVGGLMPSQMQAALRASTDLASGLGIDLQTATLLVAKAAAGHTETLARYGITVDASAAKTDQFGAVLEAVNRQFGGQATAALDTYGGKVAQLSNSWNNVEEAIGKFLVTNAFATAAMRALNQAAEQADTSASGASLSVAGLARSLGFEGAAQGIGLLETYVQRENDVAEAADKIKSQEDPFASLTAGMKAANEAMQANRNQLAAHEAQVKSDAEALSKFNAAMVEINAVGVGWQGTLATINGSVVEAIKYYLQAGVAQTDLATAYGLTAAQVKAVASALQQEKDLLQLTRSIESTYAAESQKQFTEWATTVDFQTKKVTQAILDELSAQQKLTVEYGVQAPSALAVYTKAMDALHAKRIDNISQAAQEQVITDAYTKSLYDDAVALDKVAAATPAVTTATGQAASAMGNFVGQISATNAELDAFYAKIALQSNLGAADISKHGQTVGPSAGNLAATFQWATSVAALPHYATGGPVLQDGPIYAHAGEYVIPASGASGGNAIHIYVTTPLGTPEQIADAVDRAIMDRQRNTGQRL